MATLDWGLTVSSVLSRMILYCRCSCRKDHLGQRCLRLLYKFLYHLSLRKNCYKKPLSTFVLENSEGEGLSLRFVCFQSPRSHWLTFLKSFVQNVKAETALCRLHQHPRSLAGSTIHSVPLSFQLFPISDVRRYTDITTQCRLWVSEFFSAELIHHEPQGYFTFFCNCIECAITHVVMYAQSAHPIESWNGCVISQTVFTNTWSIQFSVLQTNIHFLKRHLHVSTAMTSTRGGLILSTVCMHTYCTLIYNASLVIHYAATLNPSLWLKLMFFFSLFVFHLLYPPVVILIFLLHYTLFPASPSSFPPPPPPPVFLFPPPPPLFIHCHLFTHFPPSLHILLSSLSPPFISLCLSS